MECLARLVAIVLLAGFALSGRVQAQVEVSPRASWTKEAGSTRSVLTVGLHMRKATALSPYGSVSVRGRVVADFAGVEPSTGAFQTSAGVTLHRGGPGDLQSHLSLGAGMLFWRDPGDEELFGEFEGGLTIPASDSFGILLALRIERLADQGGFGGLTLGGAWRIGG